MYQGAGGKMRSEWQCCLGLEKLKCITGPVEISSNNNKKKCCYRRNDYESRDGSCPVMETCDRTKVSQGQLCDFGHQWP